MEFTNEQAYALGLFWADGYLLKKRGELRLEVVSEDFEYFLPFLKSLGKVEICHRQQKQRRRQSRGVVRDRKFCAILDDMDFCAKSISSPCKILKELKPDQIPYFVLGWVDGDGCFYWNQKSNYVQFAMAGSFHQDWTALENILKENSISFTVYRKTNKAGNASWLRVTGRKNLAKFSDFIYQTNMGLPRKRAKADKIHFIPDQNNHEPDQVS